MRNLTFTCDRCGEQYIPGACISRMILPVKASNASFDENQSKDLCVECADSFASWWKRLTGK